MITENFKQGLIESIKVAGQMIIDSAEDIAGKTELMTNLNVSVHFDPEMKYIPEVTIARSHVPDCEKIDRIFNAYYEREKKEQVVCRDCGRVMKDHPDLKFYILPDDEYICKDCKGKTSELVKGEVR